MQHTMSLERIKAVAEQILNRVPALRGKSEEATKQALVLPMLDALGFDIWNPAEVTLEYDADFAIKKLGQKEKVDVAILSAPVPRIYIEVKSVDQQLEGHQGQLARYFNSTSSVTLGILTNGLEWRFFTDTGDPNMIDAEPFHIARLDSADQGMDVLARFAKAVFSPESIRDYATELLYTTKIATFLRSELDIKDRSPSDTLMRWMLKSEGMYDGLVNSNVIERFRPIAKTAMTRVFREIVRRSISAMEKEASHGSVSHHEAETTAITVEGSSLTPTPEASATTAPALAIPPTDVPESGEVQRAGIVTTERELKFFSIAKDQFERSSLATSQLLDGSSGKLVPISIAYKDTTVYFGIYFNRPRYWIMRVVIESRHPYICLNVDPTVAASMVPPGFNILEPNSLEGFRLAINAPEDLHALNALVFAAFQKTIADRLRKTEVEAAHEHQPAAEVPLI